MTARIQPSFSYLDAIRRAEETLAREPHWPWVKRVPSRGQLVAQFALPLKLCPTSNQRMRGGIKQRFAEAALKRTCKQMMRIQLGPGDIATLDGRPLIRAVRFSSKESDATSDFSKVPVDRLIELGLIIDDAPKFAEVVTWSEYAPPKQGFLYLDVWTGEPA